MPTHVALLRGINVGSGDKNKIIMADLRRAVADMGHADVTTYIQTGNVIFTPVTPGEDPAQADADELATAMEDAIEAAFGVRIRVVVRSAADLERVIADNPYSAEPNPKWVHVVFLPADPPATAPADIAAAVRQSAASGSRDEATLIGRTMYLHTPDGYGRSGLATALLMKRASPVAAGTARNWSTVTKLLALCGAAPKPAR